MPLPTTSPLHLVGGGWAAPGAVYGGFLEAAGPSPDLACVVLDDGDGAAQYARWAATLRSVAPCAPALVLVPVGHTLRLDDLDGADGLLVCGGLTPAYAAALGPVAAGVRAWLDGGRPYAGFSAGAAVAASTAVVGGWQAAGIPVCPADAAEDLDEVTVQAGLALVPYAVDVHCAAWGTLGRLVSAVGCGLVPLAVGLDEDTVLSVDGGAVTVGGLGRAHVVRPLGTAVTVRSVRAGTVLDAGTLELR